MAEDVENPKKKQKLDALPVESDCPTLASSPSYSLTKLHAEATDCSVPSTSIPDGGGDQTRPGNVQPPETDKPSSSGVDVLDSGSDSDDSALSLLSGEDMWKSHSEPMSWVFQMMANGDDPRDVLEKILPDNVPDLDKNGLWRLLMTIVSEPPPRDKLLTVNTIDDVIHLIKTCKNIIVLTGAGVSVSCGIPDFRSRNGVYARLAVDFPDLPDPQAMFDISYFKEDQRPFFKFAKEIYPGQFKPSICHRFIRLIEEQGKLLRNYTQNIDTLEQVAGINNVIQCHGSFATATCMMCKHKCSGDELKDKINEQVIPRCPKCDPPTCSSVMKPDIVFFGESLPDEFHQQMAADKDTCDLLIVIGSSLKVRPVALIPNSLPGDVPQVLINKEHLEGLNFDVELLGDCDIIVSELCRHLGDKWESLANKDNPLREIRVDELLTPPETPINLRDRTNTTANKNSDNDNDSKPQNSEAEATVDDKDERFDDDKSEIPDTDTTAGKEIENVTDDKSTYSEKNTCKTADEKSENINKDKCNDSGNNLDDKLKVDNSEGSSSNSGSTHKTEESSEIMDNKCDVISKTGDMNEVDERDPATNKDSGNSDDIEKDVTEDQEDNSMKKTTDTDLKSLWMPSKWLVSKRLAPNQYCFMPPSRYVFNDAEVFMVIDSSDSNHTDDTDDSDVNESYNSDEPDIITIDDDADVLNDKGVDKNADESTVKNLAENTNEIISIAETSDDLNSKDESVKADKKIRNENDSTAQYTGVKMIAGDETKETNELDENAGHPQSKEVKAAENMDV